MVVTVKSTVFFTNHLHSALIIDSAFHTEGKSKIIYFIALPPTAVRGIGSLCFAELFDPEQKELSCWCYYCAVPHYQCNIKTLFNF